MRDVRVPIGTREILLKHPTYGDRREFVEVMYDRAVNVKPTMNGPASTGAPRLLPLSRAKGRS
jgi:hypothetical protein